MAAMRRLTPGSVAHRQDPTLKPEEFLRTLIEITARDESNAHTRMRIAAFPVITTLDQFEVGSSSIHPRRSTTSPRWNGARPRRTPA
jgi:hypothetical protein